MSCKLRRTATQAGLAALSLLACGGLLIGATHVVTDFGDGRATGQLRTLMNAAAAGDTIMIPAGTITLRGAAGEDLNASGDLDILKSVTIQGAGADSTIIDGGAVDGVFDILSQQTLTLTGVTVRNGISVQAGGGGIRSFGTLILSDSVIRANTAAQGAHGANNFGGGIRNLSVMTLNRVVVTGNSARGGGAGIHNELGATMTLTDVSITFNTAQMQGGGIYNLGSATLLNTTLSGNNADSDGGAMFSGGNGATAALTNVTINGNRSAGFGGGFYNSAKATLTNATVSGNAANFSGGGITNFGIVSLSNTIVSANSDAFVAGTSNCSGTITSLGHNLESAAGCGLSGPGDLVSADPLLGALKDNGGPTFTQALLPGSPAIDAGTNAGCPATDQRGVPRDSTCDIGAFESPPAEATASIASVTPNGGEQGQTVVVVISGQNTKFVAGTTVASFGAGIVVNSLAVNNPASATANITIQEGTLTGARTVTLTTGAEVASLASGFTITAKPAASIASVTPNPGQQGQTLTSVRVSGQNTNFGAGTTIASFGTGVVVNSLTVNSATSATANITITDGAAIGARTVTLTTGAQVASLADGFTVTAVPPQIASLVSVTPSTGQAGQTIAMVAIEGQNTSFVQGTTVASFGPDIQINSLTVSSATSATASITIQNGAEPGGRTVTLTTGTQMASLINGFSVRDAPLRPLAAKIAISFSSLSRLSDSTATLELIVSNRGPGTARSTLITGIHLKASGPGTTLLDPVLPIALGDLNPDQSITIALTISLPASVRRFSVKEEGVYRYGHRVSNRFSGWQTVAP